MSKREIRQLFGAELASEISSLPSRHARVRRLRAAAKAFVAVPPRTYQIDHRTGLVESRVG